MKKYTFKFLGNTTVIQAINVISAWHKYCEQMRGYVTSHEVVPVDFTQSHKKWEVRHFSLENSPKEDTIYISSPL